MEVIAMMEHAYALNTNPAIGTGRKVSDRHSSGIRRVVLGSLVAIATVAWSASVNAQALSADPCAAIANKDMWNLLGSGLQRKLAALCGQLDATAEAEASMNASTLSGPTTNNAGNDKGKEKGKKPRGLDVRINATPDPSEASTGNNTTQSETSIIVVGKNTVCAAWNDSGSFTAAGGFTFSGFGSSQDDGKTWTDGGVFPVGPGPDRNYGDPSLAYSARDKTVYYAALSDIGLSMWKSTDNCRTFSYIGPISSGNDDKELMAIDNNRSSPFYGRIYITWTDFDRIFLGQDPIVASFSDDGGLTWSAETVLTGSGTSAIGAWPAVAPNGDVYIAFVRRALSINGLEDQRIYKSIDGGVSFVAATNISTGQLRPERVASSIACSRQALNGNIRNLSSPQIAILKDRRAPAGYVIHTVYPRDSDGVAGADNSNVFYRRSTDGAVTWSAEVRLNDDATTTDQFFPALTVGFLNDDDHDPVVAASWYDRRLDPVNNLNFDRYAVVSLDGGLTWRPNKRISDVSSPVAAPLRPNFDSVVANCYHGDYDQMAYRKDTIHILWSDDRRITFSGPNPDIYYQNMNISD
jgi:hypothetical protein